MRSFVPEYDLRAPASFADALERMASEQAEWQAFAGGTDLMVQLEAGKLPHRKFLSLVNIPEMRGIVVEPAEVTVGALTTYTEILAHPVLQQEFRLLCEAARETGSVATQNRGTLGGNIANASPAADSPPALLVYDAELELVSARGTRYLPYHLFHTGYKKMQLAPDELIRAIRLPRRKDAWRQYFRKVGTRKAQAISKVCFAGAVNLGDGFIRDVRIAVGSVAPIPLRCARTEDFLRGSRVSAALCAEAQTLLQREIAPIDDVRSTARYRSRVAANLLQEFMAQLP